jgi:hypothetical protein
LRQRAAGVVGALPIVDHDRPPLASKAGEPKSLEVGRGMWHAAQRSCAWLS